MLYELRTYTMRPGMAPQAAAHSADVGRAVRGDDYGKLEGYWLSEIGPLNQVMHLWSYADANARMAAKAALGENQAWRDDYLPKMRPMLVRQANRLLNGVVGPIAPEGGGNVYEFRCYRLRPGAMKTWLGLFTGALPIREKYSKIVGLWSADAGQPNEVCHIWAYPGLDARAEVRAKVGADPEWQAFVAEGGEMIEDMASTIMLPFRHSPLQ